MLLNPIMTINGMILCSKLKNGLCKIVTKSQVVTKFNVAKSRLHCIYSLIPNELDITFYPIKENTVYNFMCTFRACVRNLKLRVPSVV